MKKALSLILVCAAILSLASCSSMLSGISGSDASGKSSSGGNAPRVAFYDGKEGYKYAAALQNAHLKYNYGEERNDGKGVVSYAFEYMNCEDNHYHCRYTLVGYDDACKGKLTEADDHVAIIYEKNKYVLYDFYRKMIVDDFPFLEVYEDKTFLPEGLGSATFGIFNATKKYEEEGTKSHGNTDTFCERMEFEPVTSLCANANGYELVKRIVTHGKADHESKYTEKKFIYDTETEIGLYAEFYLDNDPKVKMDQGGGEAYYEYTSSLSSVTEVTAYEIGSISPADVKSKVSELTSGHESEYKHITFSEYSAIFE